MSLDEAMHCKGLELSILKLDFTMMSKLVASALPVLRNQSSPVAAGSASCSYCRSLFHTRNYKLFIKRIPSKFNVTTSCGYSGSQQNLSDFLKKSSENSTIVRIMDEIVQQNQNTLNSDSPHEGMSAATQLSSAILRYVPGEDRYKMSITVGRRTFNFDRALGEPTNALLERARINMVKKIKHLDPNTTSLGLIVVDGSLNSEFSLETQIPFPVASIIESSKEVYFRLGSSIVLVQLNPPEITFLKFIKDALVGIPVFPTRIEGRHFDLARSEFLWESLPISANSLTKLKTRKPSREIWVRRSEKLVFTPMDSDAEALLRFTVTPKNLNNDTGVQVTQELLDPVRVHPCQYFSFQEQAKKLVPIENLLDTFRIISYNCLSEQLTTPEWFTNSPPKAVVNGYRLPLLYAELSAYRGDLYCLQEVDQTHYERSLVHYLRAELGLESCYAVKSGDDAFEGLATFYNPKKLTLIESGSVTVREEMQKLELYTKLLTIKHLEELVQRLSLRNTVLQYCVFEFANSTNNLLIVANTHLYFKPDADHIRLLQTMTCLVYLQQKLQTLKSLNPEKNISVMFCGDFNCTPEFSSCRFITRGSVPADDPDWTSNKTEEIPGEYVCHTLDMTSAFSNREITTIMKREFTDGGGFEGCIDYVFYQPKSSVQLLRNYPPLSKQQLARICDLAEENVSLPNLQTPSDHLPLIADFTIKT